MKKTKAALAVGRLLAVLIKLHKSLGNKLAGQPE